jgi:hypothetical protein
MERDDNENKKIIITTTTTAPAERKPKTFPGRCSKLNSTFGNQHGTDIIPNQGGEWSAFCEYMQKNVEFKGILCQCESCTFTV